MSRRRRENKARRRDGQTWIRRGRGVKTGSSTGTVVEHGDLQTYEQDNNILDVGRLITATDTIILTATNQKMIQQRYAQVNSSTKLVILKVQTLIKIVTPWRASIAYYIAQREFAHAQKKSVAKNPLLMHTY